MKNMNMNNILALMCADGAPLKITTDHSTLSDGKMMDKNSQVEAMLNKILENQYLNHPSRKEDSAPEKDEEPPKQGHDLLGYSKN